MVIRKIKEAMEKRRQRKTEDSQQRVDNKLTTLADQMATNDPEAFRLLNESLTLARENQKRIQDDKNTTWIVIFG